MKIYLNSKWTSVDKINGSTHFQVRNVLKKNKQIELVAVCNKENNFIIDLDEIKDKKKWLPGWKVI